MSRMLELPDAVYAALERAAADRGITPVAWIAASLPPPPPEGPEAPKGTLAERMAPYIGVVAGEPGNWSEDTGRKFTDILVAKREAGHL